MCSAGVGGACGGRSSGAGASRQNAFGWRQVLVPVGRDIRIHTAASCSILQLSRAWMQPAALHTSSLFTRPMHMQGRLPMGNTQQQGFFRMLPKCVKGEIIGQSGRWAVRVPRASIPEMIATSRSHLTAELKLPDGHYVVQTGARHARRMPMSYLRRNKTKSVMNVHLRAAPMPKKSTRAQCIAMSTLRCDMPELVLAAPAGCRRARSCRHLRETH